MREQNFLSKRPLLYLLATPIGNLEDASPRFIKTLNEVDLVACEDTRVTGKLLSYFSIKKPLVSLREHNEVSASEHIVKEILEGKKVAYVSDAGYPCISDPGAKLVEIALKNQINVTCIPGPNAALSALIASGLDCSHFYFHGFLSAKDKERKEELIDLSHREETLIFYEAPHRIKKTLLDMLDVLGNRKACIARELTKLHEEYIRATLSEMVELDEESLKGEMVIVVDGTYDELSPSIDDDELIKMVNSYQQSGLSTKDAIKKVSELTSINKNYIYKIYHLN